MSNLIRCDSCLGLKRIKGLGNIEKDCPSCRGIGWISGADKELETELSEKMDIVKPKAKRGRKKKIVNNEEILQV